MKTHTALSRRPAFQVSNGLLAIVMLLALAVSPIAWAQDLSPEQQAKLDAVASGLNRVKTNFQLAQESAGPGTGVPSGSKARLSKMRLDSAAVDMPQLKQWLSELPADAPAVQPLAQEFAALEQEITALDDRLAGRNAAPQAAPVAAPAPAQVPTTPAAPSAASPATSPTPAAATSAVSAASTPPAPPPAAAEAAPTTVRLGYPLDGVLKDARFNLREVQGNAAALTSMVAELQPQEDQMAINFRTVNNGMATLANARRKAGFTQDALDKLPANGEGVAETAEELALANSQLDGAEAYLTPLNEQLTQLINPANYPDLQSDLKRLSELSGMYSNPQILQTDRAQAAAVFEQAEAAKAEAVRIAQAYLPLMVQETEEGKRVEGSGNAFLQNQAEFLAAAEAEKQALPQQIRADLAEANKIADEAVAEQKPLFFTGGVPQNMEFAEDKLALYAALDPANSPALEKEVRDTQASLNEKEASLGALIIQQNQLPPDRYTGSDREKVIAVAVDAWTYQQADFDVLTARIPSEAWNRETMWQYSNGTWYYVDRSKLQVQLIVADEDDEKLAIIRPVNIIMNHQKGDSLIGTPFYAGDDDLQPSAYLLRDKIK